jgi:hypothetical protein
MTLTLVDGEHHMGNPKILVKLLITWLEFLLILPAFFKDFSSHYRHLNVI